MLESQMFPLVLTALEPVSHHDPRTGGESNTLTFMRQKQFVRRRRADTPVFCHLVEQICKQNQMTDTIHDLMSRLTAVEWLSSAYVRLLLDIYNHGDGTGLLSGIERYQMLSNRLQTSAARCHTLHRLWSVLAADLQLDMHPSEYDEMITSFWTLPPSVQYQMLDVMTGQHQAITTLARVWHTANKEQNFEYMKAAGRADEWREEGWNVAMFDDGDFPEPEGDIVLNVPAISVNSIRHQLVREPAMLHLFKMLGIEPAARGQGPLSPHASAIFHNGGNIKKGATQPANAFALAGEIRAAYPSLDLLGGVTTSFDLGESKLKVSAWIVCEENIDVLPIDLRGTAQARTSVFEMLDDVTRTRQKDKVAGEGQMIYNYEVLVPGTKIYVELTLTPYADALTRGALAAALGYYADNVGIVGGQSARGHGHVMLEWLGSGKSPDDNADAPPFSELYEAYLGANRDKLREGIIDGTLCSSAVVV